MKGGDIHSKIDYYFYYFCQLALISWLIGHNLQLVLTINLEECSNIHLIQCTINTMIYCLQHTIQNFFPGSGTPSCFGMRAELKKMVKEIIVHPESKKRQIND